jgi:sterol desaturase/sphingolipid hydroxylase (fatty acid hydroxylase superfamily)
VITTAITLVVLLAVFGPLERLWPARQQPWLRPALGTDLLFYLGQAFLFGPLAVFLLSRLNDGADLVAPAAFRAAIRSQPMALQALEVVLIGDLCVYWLHRASHRFELLWRFHRVHHSSTHLDWLAAHREHPLDGLLTQIAMNGAAIVAGFPLEVLMPLAAFRGLWAIYIHSNARLPVGWLRYVLGAPELHHWHHAKEPGRTANFANLAPWCDLLFGTFHLPPDPSTAWDLGVPGDTPRPWWRHLVEPLLARTSR